MRKLPLNVIALVLLVCLLITPAAAENDDNFTDFPEAEAEGSVRIFLDGYLTCRGVLHRDTVYITPTIIEVITGYSVNGAWDNDTQTASLNGEGLSIVSKPNIGYLTVNGRYLPSETGLIRIGDTFLVPLPVLVHAFQMSAEYDEEYNVYLLTDSMALFEPGETAYQNINKNSFYWLSRIISSEAYHETIESMIAVGNVVLNRVNDSWFPDTVKDVVFQHSDDLWQFSPAETGAVNYTPSDKAVAAAYMCFDGFDYGKDALFFVNPTRGDDSWFRECLEYVTTVGNHDFYK